MSSNYAIAGLKLALILSVCGIVWSAIQVAFGTMEQRKFLVGIITKWFMFLVCMSLFPTFQQGLKKLSQQLATSVSGNSVSIVEKALTDMYKDISKAVSVERSEVEEYQQELKKLLKNVSADRDSLRELISQKAQEDYRGLVPMTGVIWEEQSYNKQIELLEKSIEEEQQKLEDWDNSNSYARTYNALKEVLIIDDKNVTDRYSMNLTLATKDQATNGILSPAAIFKVTVLCAEIMWEREWVDDFLYTWNMNKYKDEDKAYSATYGTAYTDKNGNTKESLAMAKSPKTLPYRKIFNLVLALLSAICLILTSAACLIQYIMAIVEYSIISGISLFVIPCMLFDGTKDMANKILPSLFAQAAKLCMITICIYLCLWVYMDLITNVLKLDGGFSLKNFGSIIFTIILTYALCSNGPKIAETLMSGRPQMSMGEFVQAAAAGVAAGKAVQMAAKKGVSLGTKGINGGINGIRSGANGFINTLGNLQEAHGQASETAKGQTGSTAAGSYVKGFGSNIKDQAVRGIKDRTDRFLHGGSKSSAGGKGGFGRYSSTDDRGNTDKASKFADFTVSETDPETGKTINNRKGSVGEYLASRAQAGRDKGKSTAANKSETDGNEQPKGQGSSLPINPTASGGQPSYTPNYTNNFGSSYTSPRLEGTLGIDDKSTKSSKWRDSADDVDFTVHD